MKGLRALRLAFLVAALAQSGPVRAQTQATPPEPVFVFSDPASIGLYQTPQQSSFNVTLVPPIAIDLPPLAAQVDPTDFSAQSFSLVKTASLIPLSDGVCPTFSSDLALTPACLPSAAKFAWDDKLGIYPEIAIKPAPHAVPKMNWRSAFWQSFAFLVVGHGFRLMNDPGARYLLIHKPFWNDYVQSAGSFNMTRWGDGDSFIVNYIGHPMEGAVYGYIFVNNDPRGRTARFGKSSQYWYSRLRAMAWAAAWEAYFEIGPVFSEAAIGNEGGYTYVPGCGLYPCNKFPGKTFKPPTNNTGWVDFVITPVVGAGWMILEDSIERELVDRISHGDQSLKWQMLRAGLAPARSFANMFAGHLPWYRFPEDGSFTGPFGRPIQPKERPAWKDDPRFGLGMQFVSMEFPRDSQTCQNCRQFYSGYGFDFTYRLAKYAWFDSQANFYPGSGSYGKNGGVQEGQIGFKFGRSIGNWGIYSNLRNGFLHYDKALVPGSGSVYESTWRYALDLGGSVEYAASRNSVIRINGGSKFIHCLQAYADPKQPPVSVISDDYYSFVGSAYFTTGYVYRF